jgi:wobble nucleotide-excising tRNase
MILKIDIENFGIYKNFRWNRINGLNNTTFKKLNIIYGRNYSGKTTLSRVFRSLEEKKYPYFIKDPKFKIYFDDEEKNQDTIFDKELNIIVYNDDFIKDNLGFFYNENKNIKSFKVKVGKDNKKILKEIEKVQNKCDKAEKLYDKIEQKLNNKYEICKEKENELIKLLQNKANKEIKHNKLYGIAIYNINYIKKDIEFIKQNDSNLEFVLDEETENKYKKIIKEEKKEKINFNNKFDFDSFEKLFEEIKKILSQEIKPSKIIEELLNNYELEQWVKTGIKLHKNKKDYCTFCGNKIDGIRYKELDKHFDKASEEFENKISQLKRDIENINLFFNLDEKLFYENFKNDFKTYKTQFKEINNKFQKLKDKLIKSLDNKLKNRSKSLKLDNEIVLGYENLKKEINNFYKSLKKITDENNELTDNLTEKQEEAKEQLRLNDVKKFLKDIDYFNQIQKIEELKQRTEFWERRFNKIRTYKNNLIDKIEKLEDKLNDERASIEFINEFLELTSSHLKLDIKDNIDKQIFYEILRENEKAKKLSNGEQSLIAFCYFLAKVKNKLDNEKNVIIYIDDPVSSLDNNHIFSIFALLEKYITKERKYYQCFISTHNLDFLRYLKRITIPKTEDNKNDIEYFLIERLKKGNISNSQIKLLPKHLKDYTTELHYIFEKIYKLYTKNQSKEIETIKGEINNTYNDFYEIPNLLRKFLEYYLFYKYPDNDGLTIEKLDFFGKNGESEKINRIINEYSHLTYIERAWKPLDVKEIIEIIDVIIETIKDKDEEYFKHLLKAIK